MLVRRSVFQFYFSSLTRLILKRYNNTSQCQPRLILKSTSWRPGLTLPCWISKKEEWEAMRSEMKERVTFSRFALWRARWSWGKGKFSKEGENEVLQQWLQWSCAVPCWISEKEEWEAMRSKMKDRVTFLRFTFWRAQWSWGKGKFSKAGAGCDGD